MSKFKLRPALLALAGILIAIGGCAESPSAPAATQELQFLRTPPAPSFSRAGSSSSVVIDQNGGTIATAEGHRVVFPAGAVSGPTEITMSTVDGYVGVDLQPHGLVFPAGRQPILTLDYSAANTLGFTTLAIVYVDESGAISEVLPTRVLGLDGKLRTNLAHFSRYIGAGT
jgi:hypothetical protein